MFAMIIYKCDILQCNQHSIMNSTIAIRTTTEYKVCTHTVSERVPRRSSTQLGPDQGKVLCELDEPFDPRGTVVNGGGRGDTRAIESLLGDALSDGVAAGRLWHNNGLQTASNQLPVPDTLVSVCEVHKPRVSRPWRSRSPGARGSRGGSSGDVHRADLEEPGLDEEVPDPARLVDVDLD